LNLGLRDAYALVDALRNDDSIGAALRRIEWARARPLGDDRHDRLLARSFTGNGRTRRVARAALHSSKPLTVGRASRGR
jgi:2-octaprenyl-6-methoxyphenol hydroxylase